MREVEALYKTLRNQPDSYYDVQVICGNTEYGNDRLKSVKIHTALYDGNGVSIGNAYSNSCEIQLLEQSANWPRMAEFTVRARLSDANGNQKSDWLNMGTFYTDERSEDTYGNLSITGYDRMLMTEQYWTDKVPEQSLPSEWPITSRAWANLMESAGLIEVDPETVLDNSVPLIGLNTASTIRDKLKDIAAAHGGNWVVTPDGKLKLVYFHNIVDGQAAIAGIAITGVSIAGDDLIESAAGLDLNFLGMNVQRFDSSPALEGITGVNLETEAGEVAAAGTTSGYVLNGNCEFASSTGLAELCLQNVNGYQYKPFSAENALLDPAAEVGDLVIIDGRSYQMMAIDWNLSTWPTANISAPYDAEVDHEYKILSPQAKTYRKSVSVTDEKLKLYPTTSEVNSAIQQSADNITLNVSRSYVTISDYDAAIADLQQQIDGTINTFSGPVVPTLSNYPASDWTSDSEKSQHVGSLYLVTSDEGSSMAGQYYRFEQNGSTFGWVLVEDTALATALARASEAQEAADQAIADAEAAQQAADAAQGTADQARLDAVAEAARAQAAALAQAAVDATNKANQALQDAKDYATAEVEHFVFGEYAEDMESIRGQLDQKVETYYQSDDPSSGWENPEDHEGDLWYNTGDQKYYRWDGAAWEEMTANPPRAVFDVLDGKAQVFISQPVPPYWAGDLWAQGATGDILRCMTDRAEGEDFNQADWVLASKYTDDSSLQLFINGEYAEMMRNLRAQIDQKAETYYQADDPSLDHGVNKWNALAGIAIAGITIIGGSNETHKGDMWYRTTDDTTWYWDGTQWVQQTIPKDMFDFIDGKAQIFVNQPIPPYQVGDLWFNSETSDIMTCIYDRPEGSFTATDWQKRNKYTDDEKANAVETDLHTNYYTKNETKAELKVESDAIKASVVSKTGGNTQSFGWTLTDSAHTWTANGQEVLRIDSTGLHVKGDGTFTGLVSAATISGSTITGGSININDAFRVDSAGNLYASSGSFTGNVYASNIQYGATGGYFSGLGITGGTLTTGQMGTGINTSLGYANFANDVMHNQDSAPWILCEKIGIRDTATAVRVSSGTFSGVNYLIDVNDVSYNMGVHTHQISADSAGKVTIGAADWTGASHFFNIADTAFYKNAVSAITVKSIIAGRETTDANVVWNATAKTLSADFTLSAKNQDGTVVYREQEYPITLPATKAYNAGKTDGANTVDVYSVTASVSNQHEVTSGHHYVITDIVAAARAQKADGSYATVDETFRNRRITADQVFKDGQDAGANSVDVTGVTATVSNTHLVESGHHYVVTTLTPTARATKADGTYATNSESFTGRKITADQVYLDGQSSITQRSVTYIGTYGTISYNYNAGNPFYTVTVRARLSDGTYSDTFSFDVNASSAYNDGKSDSGVYVESISTYGTIGYNAPSGDYPYYVVPVRARLSNGTYSGTVNITVNASSAYNSGFHKGGYRTVYLGSNYGAGAYVSGYYYAYSTSTYMSRSEGSSIFNAEYPVIYFN